MSNKINKQDLMDLIESEEYLYPKQGTLTICVLTLKNGFQVTGESACIDPKDFDSNIGIELSKENAIEKLWQLEGYKRKTSLCNL